MPSHHRARTLSDSSSRIRVVKEETEDPDIAKKSRIMVFKSMMSSTKLFVLVLLCMQNTMFTVLRRYSQGVLKEVYSKVRRHIMSINRYSSQLKYFCTTPSNQTFYSIHSMKYCSSENSSSSCIPHTK